ncbi:MAG: helix-turn-helix domain-containing protein [Burkholderiales bacterium]|nr:helix-turn-helix domain-containing protein [Burkholderiales bacterium]
MPPAISDQERAFFIGLGLRVAELRKLQSITQVQLAEALDVSQQTLQACEVGRRRISVSALPTLAKALGVLLEELMGESTTRASKRGR